MTRRERNQSRKGTKRALTGSILAIVLCVVLLAGATFAWFTDTASTKVNTINSGRLKIELQQPGEEPDSWVKADDTLNFVGKDANDNLTNTNILWEPGAEYVLPELKVVNKGNLALKYRVVFSPIEDSTTATTGADLADVLDVYVTKGNDRTFTGMTLRQVFESKDDLLTGHLDNENDASESVIISVKMQETAGNQYQGLTIKGVKVEVQATQYTYEKDSKDDQYDKDAQFATAVATADELVAAIAAGENIVLTDDINLSECTETFTTLCAGVRDGSSYTGDSYKGTLDGNGHTISNVNNTLIGVLDGGVITDLNLVASIDTTGDSVAALVGVMVGGVIDNVTVSGSVKGNESVGGVVGRILAEGTVRNCVNSATITTTGEDKAGGIAGAAYYTKEGKEMTISGCVNSGSVTSVYAAGGIVGFSAANLIDCSNTAVISGRFAGGIVGYQCNYGEVSGNANTANITATGDLNSMAGGIIGWIAYIKGDAYANNETITVTGNVNSGSISAAYNAGGIVGLAYNQAVVTGNKNSAQSISAGTFAAGIVGGLQSQSENLLIGTGVSFTVTGNTTTTPLASIGGSCKDLVAYNNVGTLATIRDNVTA